MKWNENDTKYILKRIILYLIITGIVFFAGAKCTKATTISVYNNVVSQNMPVNVKVGELVFSNGIFSNAGEGYVNFVLATSTGYLPNWSLSQVKLEVGTSATNIVSQYVCDMGTYTQYTDSTVESIYYSVKCPVNIPMGQKIYKVTYSRLIANAILGVNFGDIFTFVSSNAVSSDIMNGTNQQIQDQINNDNTNTQQILNNVAYYSTQEINSINNASTTAHADAVAISTDLNNLNDTINADFNFDNDMFEALDLFEDDTNILRTIIMFPINIMLIVSNAIHNDSCVPYNIGSLYGTNLVLPCINYKQYIGNTLYALIDTIFAVLLISGFFVYLRNLITYILQIGLKGYELVNVEVFK